jgi:hypothetical protein
MMKRLCHRQLRSCLLRLGHILPHPRPSSDRYYIYFLSPPSTNLRTHLAAVYSSLLKSPLTNMGFAESMSNTFDRLKSSTRPSSTSMSGIAGGRQGVVSFEEDVSPFQYAVTSSVKDIYHHMIYTTGKPEWPQGDAPVT